MTTPHPDGRVPDEAGGRTMRIGFVMERHIGHRTYADNLRRCLDTEPDLSTSWYPVEYAEQSGPWERAPMVPESVRSMLRGRSEARRVLDDSFDATVFNTQVPAVIGGRAVRRPPYFLCSDVTPVQYDAMASGYSHRPDRAGPLRWWKHRANTAAFRGAACNLVWSTWVGESLVSDYGVDPARVEVVPPGVDTSRWQPGSGSGDGPLQVLFVGGEFERKGGDLLLDAFRALPSGTAELTIVTKSNVPSGDGVRVVNDLSANDPRLVELFRTSDVFALPSLAETFGIAYIEGSAAGLPVLASRIGGVPDIVADGETGFTIEPGDQTALTQRLAELADDAELRRRMGAAARRRAEQRFDAATNARRLVSIVRDQVEAR